MIEVRKYPQNVEFILKTYKCLQNINLETILGSTLIPYFTQWSNFQIFSLTQYIEQF